MTEEVIVEAVDAADAIRKFNNGHTHYFLFVEKIVNYVGPIPKWAITIKTLMVEG